MEIEVEGEPHTSFMDEMTCATPLSHAMWCATHECVTQVLTRLNRQRGRNTCSCQSSEEFHVLCVESLSGSWLSRCHWCRSWFHHADAITYFLTATQVNHVLAELLITDEPVVNTQEMSLLAFLLERIRDEVLVIPRLLPVSVPVESPFFDVVIRNREEIHGVLDEFLVLLCSISQEVPARAVEDTGTFQYDKHTVHCALGSVSSKFTQFDVLNFMNHLL